MTAPAIPHRVQLGRKAGWRMPENTVKVDRTTRWGNPYRIGDTLGARGDNLVITIETAEQSARLFRDMAACGWLWREEHYPPKLEIVAKLRGKNLACWCSLDQPCHADVLLEIANR